MKYQGNPKLEEYHRKYREEHCEQKNAWMREYIKRPAIQKRKKEYEKLYWKKNKEQLQKRNTEYFQTHKEQFKKYDLKYRNTEKAIKTRKIYNQTKYKKILLERKIKTLSYYAKSNMPKCLICGESELKFLTIDHIKPRKEHNHKRNLTGSKLISWLIRNNYPEGFQTLDFNCNCAKKFAFGLKEPPQFFIDKYKEYYYKKRDEWQKNKKTVLDHYSNGNAKCACCKKDRIEWLTIDHINGKTQDTVENRIGGLRLYRWLLNNNYPNGYQTLCYNCNFAKGKYGICPHNIINS